MTAIFHLAMWIFWITIVVAVVAGISTWVQVLNRRTDERERAYIISTSYRTPPPF